MEALKIRVLDNTSTCETRCDAVAAPHLSSLSAGLKQLLIFTMEQIGESLNAERTTLFLIDEERQELWSVVATGDGISEIRIKASQGIAGSVMQSGVRLNITDAYADSRFNPDVDKSTGFVTRNILCCPIYDFRQQPMGVVQVLNKIDGDRFTEHDERLLKHCGNQAATAIENAQLYESVNALRDKELSLTRELHEQHRQLQEAFQKIEQSKSGLEKQLASKRWTRRSAFAVAAVVFALAAALVLPEFKLSQGEELASVATVGGQIRHKVTTREVADYLRLPGTVRPARWIEVVSPLDSVVESMHFRYGETVTKGQKLAVLDVGDRAMQLRDARTAQIEAMESLERLENWANSTEVRRARRDVMVSEESLNQERRNLEDTRRLYEREIIARSEMENAVASVRDKERALVGANESLDSVLAEGADSKVQIARFRMQNAEQTLAEIVQSIEAATVYSPADGIIFPGTEEKRGEGDEVQGAREGAPVSRNTPMFSIASMQGISLDVAVPESQILDIEEGQSVVIEFEALDLELEGQISFIAGRAVKGEDGEEEASFPITVAVTEISTEIRDALRLGMSATANVEIFSDPDAPVLPFEAVLFEDGRPFVLLATADKTEKRFVNVMLTLPDGIAIDGGLVSGDEIMIPAVAKEK